MPTPQEIITEIREAVIPKVNTEEQNKQLCERFPFLKWYGDPLYLGYSENTTDYSFTWEDEIPSGWRKAFCPQMWEELKSILEKADYVDKFRFAQIKEKYGTLRLYHDGVPEEIFEEICAWESKYDRLSENVCIHCGKPAKYMTLGWITFICEECAQKHKQSCIKKEDIEAFYDTPREDRKKLIVVFEDKTDD